MYLHEDPVTFREIIDKSSQKFKIPVDIIEKDYYVFMILKLIAQKCGNDNVVFKGGTSLSKAYKAINRFSEDIDLCLPAVKIRNSRARTNLVNAILGSIEELGLVNTTEKQIQERGVYNDIQGKYNSVVTESSILPYIKIETAHRIEEYPIEIKKIHSYLGGYIAQEFPDKLEELNMKPFEIDTVFIYRTFVDKLYALADYYLAGKDTKYSRHMYDVYKIMLTIDWRDKSSKLYIRNLIQQVGEARIASENCLSAQPGVSLRGVLQKAMVEDFYRTDYEKITSNLLFEDVSYQDCKDLIVALTETNIMS